MSSENMLVDDMSWGNLDYSPDKRDWKLEPIEFVATQQGQYYNLKIYRRAIVYKNAGGGTRGAISQFSNASRKRMLDTIAKIDKNKIQWGKYTPKFITLTYKVAPTPKRAKRDLKVFFERLNERWQKASFLWRMEYQKRGAIHFHLILFNVPFVKVNSNNPHELNLQSMWNEVSEQNDRNTLDLEVIRSINGVMFYVSKYMAKEDTKEENSDDIIEEEGTRIPFGQMSPRSGQYLGLSIPHIFSLDFDVFTGRFWGVYGRKHMPYGEKKRVSGVATLQTMVAFKHISQNPYAKVSASYTIYSEEAGRLWKRFWGVWEYYRHENTGAMVAHYKTRHAMLSYQNWQSRIEGALSYNAHTPPEHLLNIGSIRITNYLIRLRQWGGNSP